MQQIQSQFLKEEETSNFSVCVKKCLQKNLVVYKYLIF